MCDHPSNGWERPKQAGWEFRVRGLEFRISGFAFSIQGLGFRAGANDFGFRVWVGC